MQRSTVASPTRTLAEYAAHSKLEDFPGDAIEAAKLTILDTVGVGLAALEQPVAQSISDYFRSLGGNPRSTVLGVPGFKTAPPLAAHANGCLMNLLDLDGFWHFPTFVLPAVLAVAEEAGSSGRDALEAFLIGTHLASRLRLSIDSKRPQHAGPTHRGWYHITLYGPLSAALAAGKLLGLDVRQLQGAIGTAAGNSGGVRQNMYSTAKSFASGNAAALGVHAALLAQAGVLGACDILEGRLGLIEAVCLPNECDWSPIADLGEPFEVVNLGLKLFPAVGPTQSTILAVGELKKTHRFASEEIVSVEAGLPLFAASDSMPESGLTAGFSWRHVLACTLVDGRFWVDHLTAASLGSAEVQRIARTIVFVPPEPGGSTKRVSIELRDGRRLVVEVAENPDEVDLQLSADQIEQKFRECAGRALPADAVSRLERDILHMECLDTAGQLLGALVE